MKKILFGIAITLLLLLVALVTLPYFFKDEIIAQVKKAANESLTATVEFKDVDVSVFRHFPKLSIGLEGLDVTNGPGPFEGVKLVQCPRLDVTVDLWSAIFGSSVVVNGLFFEQPDIRVYALSNGAANYDITKPDPAGTTAASSESSPVKLERYGISDGKILYDDRGLDMKAEMSGLDHTGSGEFTADLYDFVMETAIKQLSVNYGGIQYLRNARADWQATLGADMKNMKFTFKENDLKVNDLALMLDGWVQMPENTEDIRMDLTFGTPANTFKSLLSIIPGAYTKDFGDVQANGTVQFAGFAKGTYNETVYPAFKLDFKVGNADFKYPSLPLGVTNINVDASINSPTARMNDMTVNIPKFSLRIGSNPLEGYFNLKTPESNPTVDTRINGTLNLGELSKAFPVEGVQELAGIIKANMTIKASMNQIDQQQYDQVNMAGDFAMTGVSYRAADMPPVKINQLTTSLTPQRVDIQTFDAKLGKSDLRASGSIDNLLAYFSTNKTMRGNLNFSSAYFDANEWMEEPEPAATASKVPSDVPAAASEKVFDRWDFMMDGKINKLKYDVYDLSDVSMKGHFMPNKMSIDDFGMKIGGTSDLRGSGQILNAWNYLFDNQTVAGTVNLQSTYFDLNQFMTDDAPAAGSAAAAAPPAESVVPVPENMDMTINANFAKVKYTTYDLNNLDGKIIVKNEVAKLQDCTANLLGGQVGLNGEYNTQNLAKPSFNMDMALQNMGFKESFQNFVTVKTLAPVAQLIDGKFNTTLSISGLLGKDMTPDFNTLSAAGFLETISAVFNNFKPMNNIAEKLNVEYLKKLELGNTKNWFEIKDGRVTIKPFNVQVRDISMQIGGSHGLSSEMAYQIVTKTPRKTLEKSGLGAVNTGLNFLSKEASKAGVNIAQGEFINVRFDLTGSLFNPKVGMKILGSDGQSTIKEEAGATVQATVDKAKDSLTNVANRELDKAKDKAKAAADSLTNVATQKAKEAADKATQEVKDKVGEKVGDEVNKKAGEVLGDQGQKKVEDVKKKLDDWDPFKKKKKN
ncbi:MAG TPA: AsmA-like C-terminal region-containing protein [Saprospiraceae bacterium]|nr:AsmA-like C-terminal region-containing protein [Saprospiraceae bacterium]HPI07337.1 AsmA-like C-terminal region-containing protein [Saprospiraceae bacterium]